MSSYFSFGVLQSGNQDSESCPPPPVRTDSYESVENYKHGNGLNQAGTMISNDQGKESDKDGELCASAKVESGIDYFEGMKQMTELTEGSAFISANLCEFLHACLPNIVRGCKWILLYR